MAAIADYAIHLVIATILMVVFFKVYTWITPFDEILLIRQGNNAASLSLGGALIGFALTLASCIMHTTGYQQFAAWAAGGLVVQALVYIITCQLLHMSKEQIEANNTAFGGLLAAISLAFGAVNAACIS